MINNKPPFGFLKDCDGNFCEKRLAGLISGLISTIMYVTYFFYGLGHIITDHTIIDAAYALTGLSGALLGITVFQKPRSGINNEKID